MTFLEFHIEKRQAFYLVQPPLDLTPSMRELDNLRRHRLVQNVFMLLDSVTSTFENRTDPNLTFANLTSIIASSETKMQLTFQRHDGCGQLHRDFYGNDQRGSNDTDLWKHRDQKGKFLDSVRNQLATRITLYLESERAERVHSTHVFDLTLELQVCDDRVYRRHDQYVERDDASGIKPYTRCPAGQAKKTTRPKRTFR